MFCTVPKFCQLFFLSNYFTLKWLFYIKYFVLTFSLDVVSALSNLRCNNIQQVQENASKYGKQNCYCFGRERIRYKLEIWTWDIRSRLKSTILIISSPASAVCLSSLPTQLNTPIQSELSALLHDFPFSYHSGTKQGGILIHIYWCKHLFGQSTGDYVNRACISNSVS